MYFGYCKSLSGLGWLADMLPLHGKGTYQRKNHFLPVLPTLTKYQKYAWDGGLDVFLPGM